VELYVHSPNVFIAWCLVKHRDNFTFLPLPLCYNEVLKGDELEK